MTEQTIEAMNLVQDCLDKGIYDRKLIREQTGLTRNKVERAFRDLRAVGKIKLVAPSGSAGKGKGRTPAIFVPVNKSQFANISSIFQMR
jgi:hypothetical protein